ncbi:MAG TPA: AAA family ATPase [Candidatus Micrarchaeota archaeon]|nr:AAA family ATPase [Candidatus Micrarchaeota archaeon]
MPKPKKQAEKPKIIALTGVPGTGKTSVAAELVRLGFRSVDLNALARSSGMILSHDEEDDSDEVDISLLSRAVAALLPILGQDIVFEGHLACEFKIRGAYAIVLRTNPDTLKQRLSSRGYSWQKISKNAMSEMLDYCVIKSRANYKKVIELDTTDSSPGEIAQEIAASDLAKLKSDKVDWSAKLLDIDVRELVARKMAKLK